MVRYLVTELCADVNQSDNDDCTPLACAAKNGSSGNVRCLVEELGADVRIRDFKGNSALILGALFESFSVVQYLIGIGVASIDEVNNDGESVWDVLEEYLEEHDTNGEDDDDSKSSFGSFSFNGFEEFTAMLRTMVLHSDPPHEIIDILSPEDSRLVSEGTRLRAELPAYLVRRRALLDAHCPLLPPLCDMVHGNMELTTGKSSGPPGPVCHRSSPTVSGI
jgi:hypothetical protein